MYDIFKIRLRAMSVHQKKKNSGRRCGSTLTLWQIKQHV